MGGRLTRERLTVEMKLNLTVAVHSSQYFENALHTDHRVADPFFSRLSDHVSRALVFLVRNFTGDAPGAGVTYEDLWKFTLVNYNAGPGCLADAISGAQRNGLELTWEYPGPYLTPACAPAMDYVNEISR